MKLFLVLLLMALLGPGTPVFGERQSTPSDETPTALRRPENVGPVEIAEGVITHQTDIEFTQELYAARNRIHDLEALVSELQNQAEERETTARDRISDLHEALRGQAPREPNSVPHSPAPFRVCCSKHFPYLAG